MIKKTSHNFDALLHSRINAELFTAVPRGLGSNLNKEQEWSKTIHLYYTDTDTEPVFGGSGSGRILHRQLYFP